MRTRILGATALALSLCGLAYGQPSAQVLAAIQQVESGGQGSKTPDGDGGRAIGPFQAHYGAWKDATDFDKSIGGTYQDCHDPEYARKICRAYLTRYAGKSASPEQYARTWNGGPRGATKKATLGYWAKVKKCMKSLTTKG